MMKVIILLVIILATKIEAACRPRFHYWRPYNGTIPNDAFVAGLDDDGRRNYIVKIMPLDEYSWVVPAQLRECEHHVNFGWCCGTDKVMKIDQFIEVLCTNDPLNLAWRKVNRFADEISNHCCFVQGGYGKHDNHVYNNLIGRIIVNGILYTGRAYLERSWDGIHFMDGMNSTKLTQNFEMLTYDCQR
ncbi:hypothetical protein WA026_009463 [Henosepilachna vigintioctopunctata]|uniref:Uncharacterized protein n=1 Tax=Henosepilachna vigintioctopunctata TaxID=420089 RepID=A0AAW1TVS1_9CUCU